MKKKILALVAMLFAVASWAAAIDANKATDAELASVKGVGPSLSKRIVDARKEAPFKDWADFMSRVKGVKEKSATRLSAEGLTIDGKTFGVAPAPAAHAAKTEAKTETRNEAKADPKKTAGVAKAQPKP